MLTERERRELEIMERELRADPRFAMTSVRAAAYRFRRQILRPRSLTVFGCLVMVAAIFLGLDETFVQGLLVTTLGLTWSAWNKQQLEVRGNRRATPRRR